MNLKEQVEELRRLYDLQAQHAKNYLDTGDEIKKATSSIKETMDNEGLDSFGCAVGTLEIENKSSFSVPKERKEEMIAYFEADATLAPFVKTVKDVHYQTRAKVFRNMLEDENKVPDFVKVSHFSELKPKFLNFKEEDKYLKKIKSKQKDKREEGENEETDF